MGNIRSKITIKKGKKNLLKNFAYKFLSKFKIYDFRSSLASKKVIIKEKFDLIISSSDPKSSHLIAESLIKNNPNITNKWIQYWGDPFASDINKKTLIPNTLIKESGIKNFNIFKDNNKNGVDFILNTINGEIVPIEVGMGNKKVKQVKKAIEKYKTNYGILISNKYDTIQKEDNIIHISPLMFSLI